VTRGTIALNLSAPRANPARVSPPQPSRAYANYVAALLSASYVVNYLDRYVLSMLAGPIKAELGFSDGAMGLLLGPAFALLYTGLGVPVAWLADRSSRRNLIAAGMAVWSAFTALSGMARSFGEIALARFGVGIGEAAGAAPAHSLIADYFPPERRATALSIFQMGVPIGQMLGTVIGGLLVAPLGWRRVFLIVGLPGIAIALLLRLTVREPPRSAPAPSRSLLGAVSGLLESVGVLLRIRTFLLIALGGMFASTAGTGFGFWLPQMFVRSHGMSLAEFGVQYGVVSGAAGVAGTLIAGLLADRLARFDPRWRLRVAAASVAFSMPLLIAICAVPDPRVAVLISIPSGMIGSGYAPVLFAIAQSLAPARVRAVTSSVLILFITGGGMLIGPWVIGFLSDSLMLRFGTDALRVAMIAVLATMTVGVVALLLATRTLTRDLARAERAG
jgi:MFS family permease